MKQLWSAAFLLAGMIFLLVWNANHLTHTITPLRDTLNQAEQAARKEDWFQAEQLTRQVSHDWEGLVSYLYLVQSHHDIDEVSILLEESMEYMEEESSRTYLALNARICGVMEEICRMEKFSVGNLM